MFQQITFQDDNEYNFNSALGRWIFSSYKPAENDTIKKYNEKMLKVFEKRYQIGKFFYNDKLKNASESAKKSNKMNDEQRKQFIDEIYQMDKILNQTNCYDSKDTLLKNKKQYCKKLSEVLQINGVKGDPEFSKLANMGFETKIPAYFENLYAYNKVKNGEKLKIDENTGFMSEPCIKYYQG